MRTPTTFETIRLVAAREISTRARDRGFLVSSGVTLVILLAVLVVPSALGFDKPPAYDVSVAADAAPLAPAVAEQAKALGVNVTVDPVPATDLAATVREGKADAGLSRDGIVVEHSLPADLGRVLQGAHQKVVGTQQLAASGLDPSAVARALQVQPLSVQELDPSTQDEQRKGLAFAVVFVLYLQLLAYGVWVGMGIAEEKSSRVVEVLLSTVPARTLLTGKLVGIGLLGLAQLLLISVCGVGAATATGRLTFDSSILGVVGVVLAWFVLGFALYSSLFAMAAARVSRQEELQNTTGPVTFLVVLSFFASFYVMNSQESTIGHVLSVLPPFSALLQPVLIASGGAVWWQAVLAAVLMIAATVAVVLVAGRMYEGAVLRMGGKVAWRDAWGSSRPAPVR